jgi:hypothetical protein
MPWMLPLSEVSGVLMSACASTQMTAISRPRRSLIALAVPLMVPIAAESEDEAAFLGVVVDLFAEGLGNGADGSRLQHVAVRRVGRWHELVI